MISALPDIVAKRAALAPQAVALEDARTGTTISYAELDRRAGRAAALIADRGVAEGDRVAILCRNRTAFFEILFGCARLGAILVPLNWRMPPAELDALVADCEPALLFVGAEDRTAAAGMARRISSIDLDEEYEGLIARTPDRSFAATWPAERIWYLIYTSGTTGTPKGVIYTVRMALANYVNIRSATDLRSTDTTVNFLPLFHTAGINLHTLPMLMAGGRVIVLDGFEPDALIDLFRQERIDVFFAVPSVYQALAEHPLFPAAPHERVRHWACGGAPLPNALAEHYRRLGIRLCNGMGMTETGPTAFLLDPADAWDRIGSVGKPQLLCSVRIVDEQNRDVPDGEVGDLLFGGPGITPGYWQNAAETAAAFTSDGWLRSGDLACRDADGFTFIAGRRKDMFISGGENVYPAEVENVLAAHPAVQEAAVVAERDGQWGEIGHAYILPIPGVAALDVAELTAFCRARLAPYKVPVRFEIVGEFPRTAAGKIRKHLLSRALPPATGESGRRSPAPESRCGRSTA